MHVPCTHTAHDLLFYTGCQMECTVLQTLWSCATVINENGPLWNIQKLNYIQENTQITVKFMFIINIHFYKYR